MKVETRRTVWQAASGPMPDYVEVSFQHDDDDRRSSLSHFNVAVSILLDQGVVEDIEKHQRTIRLTCCKM